jgi:two-component system, NtrC family, sensor kinase
VKTGIQYFKLVIDVWIPACAGMTTFYRFVKFNSDRILKTGPELRKNHFEKGRRLEAIENGQGVPTDEREKEVHYSRLYRKFIILTLVGSLIPLLLVGWGIYLYYSQFSQARMKDSFRSQVDFQRKILELFIRERTNDLHNIAETHTLNQLKSPEKLKEIFDAINREGRYFTDLGVISDAGRHLAYIGPYSLMDKDYSQTFWFKEVMTRKNFYISDMFTGFRHNPHMIIAVFRSEGGQHWILRATIDTEYLRSLVESVKIGRTGEAFLLNGNGIFQTSPRSGGKIMDKAPLAVDQLMEDSGIHILNMNGGSGQLFQTDQLVAYAWLKEPHWVLILKQDYAEAFRDVNHANRATLIFLHLSLLGIVIITVVITRTMIKTIKRRDREADQLNKQLMQASKLASLGELSAGVAHEINNPLAIILTENQVMRDCLDATPGLDEELAKDLLDSISQIDNQIQRCTLITHNLLRFSRRTKSMIEMVNLNAFLGEVVQLMEGRARGKGIQFRTELEKDLAPLLSDPSQLQQVFLNLITNAIDAHEDKPYGIITLTTRSDLQRKGVEVRVEDTGSGIEAKNLERIFDPFFTTKPVGKGTGLGLSISYSIIKRLGGDISVQSVPGQGTEFIIFLPFSHATDSQGNSKEGSDRASEQPGKDQ